jgi:hypothetical protein
MRTTLLVVVLVFVAALLALTVHALVAAGPDVLTVLSVLVLVLLGVGVVGALRRPPPS